MSAKLLPFTLSLPLAALSLPAQIDRDMSLASVRRTVRAAAADLPDVERRWRERLASAAATDRSWRALFGYAPPGRAVQLAYLHAFLYAAEGRVEDARAAAGYLVRMAGYRERGPAALRRARAEYADGLPAVPSFFQLADYAEAWARVRGCAAIAAATRRAVEDAIAGSADFVFVFPEWGPHNRAVLRAESLLWAAKALPDHPRAPTWREMAAILAADSIGAWEIEDAQIYHPVWLLALLRYADAAGDERIARSIPVRWYLRYFLELLTPAGNVPAFGDAWWNAGLARYYVCLEWGAAALRDPELKWGARRVYRALGPFDPDRPSLGHAIAYARVIDHLDPDLEPRRPELRSGPVLDDVIGKKVVFRTGLGDDDLYLLLNYRDEGDWGRTPRDYLRRTLAVEEEKMHHGHADENAIPLLMDRGAVLLHDAGYREVAPSGPYGAFRADLFHNRLVARRGRLAAGQDVLEFLRDSGAYRRVRTEAIDFARFESAEYSRTRVTDRDLGYVWDRVLVFTKTPRLFVVFDVVRATRAGYLTLANLWAAQRVAGRGRGWAVGAYDSIGSAALPRARELLLVFPGADEGTPGTFPLRRHRQAEHVLHETESRWFDAGTFAGFVTVLWPVAPGADTGALRARVRRLPADPGGRAVGVRIDAGDETVTIGCKADLTLGLRREDVRPRYDPERGAARYGGVETDADLVVVRRRGDRATWCATNMTRVRIGGRTVFAAKPLNLFQTSGRSDVVGRTKWRRWEDTADL